MREVIKQEIERNTNKYCIVGILVFIFMAIVIHQVGIEKHKTDIKQNREFIEAEKKKVDRYINVKQFGWAGYRKALESTPLISLFFNSSPLNVLISFIDVGVRLELSQIEIGKGFFENAHRGRLDYSWYILIIGGIAIAIWGFFSFRNKEYIIFLRNFGSIIAVYSGILLVRIFLILISLITLAVVSFFQFIFNGISLNSNDGSGLFIFFLISLIVFGLLLIVSAVLGATRRPIRWGIITALSLFVFVWLWPEIINVVFSRIAAGHMKSFYNHEITKVEKLMKFEQEIYEKVGTGRYTKKEQKEIERNSGEDWYNKEYKEIEKMELEIIEETEGIAKKFQLFSIINPVTFWRSVNNELSSKGFNAYIKFFKLTIEEQRIFLRYYLDKRWIENYTHVEHILKNDGDIVVKSKSSLPAFFVAGIIWNLFLIIVASFFGYFRFKRWMLKEEGESEIGEFKFNIKKGKNNYLLTADEGLRTQVFNYFSNLGKSSLTIQIDGETQQKGENEFIYLCSPSRLPFGVSAKSLYKMLYKKKCIEDLKVWEVMLRYAVESKRLIILDNFFKGLKGKEVEEILRVIRKEDIISLYIGDNNYEAQKLADAPIIYSLNDTSIDGIREIAEVVKKKK
ncbi:MAG: hypothetical protein GTO45_39330 [Candidatus Aminicenantes bacterium]|nr:hypothetical protein [Candidatus Aminicenantes bacterium]NIM84682.1 hypothetical protein [Candidatus Aminicenantes bacterium]NIN24181.1 hypothetical protein [Candidatus Aminicenantes bacterium]NIN47906.1 hypothetical protein [Candidatus Aminicenantes bacterium]NIN90844.1 hypothetical protein [Candidatus Aminicenantes bacterium]